MSEVLYFLTVVFSFLVFKYFKKKKIPEGLKPVPLVGGCLPIIGHYWKISAETLPTFIAECCKKYGKIFKLKIFNKTWIALCDKEFYPAFFSASESGLSLFKMFDEFFITPAFGMQETKIKDWMPTLRQAMNSVEVFKGRCCEDKELCERMAAEAFQIVEELKREGANGSGIDLTPIMLKYVCSIVSSAIFGVHCSDELGTDVYNLIEKLNKAVELATFSPHFIVSLLHQKTLDFHISKIADKFNNIIQEYRRDPKVNESQFLRFLVDVKSKKTKRVLTETEIRKIIPFVMFLSTEGATATMVLTLLNILTRPEVLQKVRKEVAPIVGKGDWEALLDLKYLHGCVMETARLGGKVALSDRARTGMKTLNGYYVGDADYISIAGMLHHTSKESFPQCERFSPEEYLDKKGYNILTWGAGTHMCTGRILGQKMIKIMVAILIGNVNFDSGRTHIGKEQPFSNTSIMEVEHKVFLCLN